MALLPLLHPQRPRVGAQPVINRDFSAGRQGWFHYDVDKITQRAALPTHTSGDPRSSSTAKTPWAGEEPGCCWQVLQSILVLQSIPAGSSSCSTWVSPVTLWQGTGTWHLSRHAQGPQEKQEHKHSALGLQSPRWGTSGPSLHPGKIL